MKKLLFIIVAIFFTLVMTAQSRKNFNINPGQKFTEAIPANAIYSYPEFREGVVTLRDEKIAKVRLNYNSLFGEMQFIDPKKGDTISLADESTIKLVAIGRDTFYFDETWLQLMASHGEVKLAKKRIIVPQNKQAIGAKGAPAFAAETYTKYTGSQQARDLVAQEIVTLTVQTTYFFGDQFNHFSTANKKNLLENCREHRKQVEAWLKENKIQYYQEEDMKRLFDFLKTL